MAKKRYVELEGQVQFTDRNLVTNLEQKFLKAARKNPDITWGIRDKGFQSKKHGLRQWSQPRKDVYALGATKTKEEYWDKNAKGELPKAKPQHQVSRTSAGATFYHAGLRENRKLKQELARGGRSQSEQNALFQEQSIKFYVAETKASDISFFQKLGKKNKEAFKLATELREDRIAKLEPETVRVTQSAEFEGRNEYNARLYYEGIQELRKTRKADYLTRIAKHGVDAEGRAKLVPSNPKITDEFIDRVNARQFETVAEQRAFKAGALTFLQNKELYQQVATPESQIFTEHRLEDTRSWHSGSTIEPFESEIPHYIYPDKSKVDTKFVGSTKLHALTRGGPETSETVKMADPAGIQDYGALIDEEVFESRSSFVNMTPDQPTADFNYNIDEPDVPVQITSAAEELQASEEPTIRQTLVNRTKGGTWRHIATDRASDIPDVSGSFTGRGHGHKIVVEFPVGGRTYYSKHVDTGQTAADLNLKATDPVQYSKVTAKPGASPPDMSSMITSSISKVVNLGVPVQGSPETDAVQSFLDGDAFTEEGDVADAGNIKPSTGKGVPGLLEGFRETSAMIDIEDAAVTEFKGKSQIRSAYPAQFAGSTSTFTSKINEPLVQTPGGEPGYKMTQADIARQDAISAAEARGQGVGLKPTVTRQEVGGGHDIKIYTDPEVPMSQREAMVKFGGMLEQRKEEYYARKEAGTQEAFIQDIKDRKTGIRIISGGQVGADLIGLEQATELGFRTGGTAPKGFKTSQGVNLNLSEMYNLTEVTDQAISQYTGNEKFYGPRTEQNVLKSDVTFLFTNPENRNSAGSSLTRQLAKKHGKTLLENPNPKQVQSLIAKTGPDITVNIAGNREFKNVGVIRNALAALQPSPAPDMSTYMAEGDLGIPGATTSNTAPITSKDVAKTVPTNVDQLWGDGPAYPPAIQSRVSTPKTPAIAQFVAGDILKYTQDNGPFEIVVSKGEHIKGVNVVYHKALEGKGWSSTEVVTGRGLFHGGTRKEVMAQTQKFFSDPKQATDALKVIKEVRASNAKAGFGPTGETIELFKSRVSGEFTTKAGVRKTGVKALAGKAKAGILGGPGSTVLNTLGTFALISPIIGAFGAVVQEQKREEEAQAAYPLHPPKDKTLWSRFADMEGKDFGQALMHRFVPEEIYGKEGYPSLKKVKEWRKRSKGYDI